MLKESDEEEADFLKLARREFNYLDEQNIKQKQCNNEIKKVQYYFSHYCLVTIV